jgi:hypothetical protein
MVNSPSKVSRLLVVSVTDCLLHVFDLFTHAKLADIPLPSQPHELVIDEDRRPHLAYISVPYRDGFYQHEKNFCINFRFDAFFFYLACFR